MDEQLEFLKSIVSRLDSTGIPYMLTDSMAMAVYALPRMTRDLDLVIECDRGDIDKIVHLFNSDCYIDRQAVQAAITDRTMFNIIHNEWIIKADFIIRKENDYRRMEFGRRRTFTMEDTKLFVTAPEDLILSKLIWAKDSDSGLQVQDVQSIIDAVRDLDWPYLEKWASRLTVSAILQEVRSS